MANEERLMVLKMISEGRLTPEQAESLLQTLDETSPTEPDFFDLDVYSIHRRARKLMRSGVETARKQVRELRREIQKLHDDVHKSEHKARRKENRTAREEARKARRKIVVVEAEANEPQDNESE